MTKLQNATKKFIISILIMFAFFYIGNALFQNTATNKIKQLDKKQINTTQKTKIQNNTSNIYKGNITVFKPNYPERAIKNRKSGTVGIQIEKQPNEDKKIGLLFSSGDRDLDEVALNSAKNSVIIPDMENGKPIQTIYQYDIVFSLKQATPILPPESNVEIIKIRRKI